MPRQQVYDGFNIVYSPTKFIVKADGTDPHL